MTRRAVLILIALVFFSPFAQAQALLAPPFGRKWAESPSGLLQWADGQNLDVFVEMPGKHRDLQIFTFKNEGGGLPGHPADSLEARFYQGRLYEITVFYNYPGLTAETVRERFLEVKGTLTKRHGELLLNGKADNTADEFLTREESFHYEPSPGVFLLIAFTEVTDLLRKKAAAKFSVVYHNGNLAPPSKKALPEEE